MQDSKFTKYLDSKKYEIKTNYSSVGWFLLTFIGISAKPRSVDIFDKETGEKIETITDELFLNNFIGR